MKYWYNKDIKGVVCEPNSVDEWMRHIWEVGLDYDGCNTVKSLQELIDELIEMSVKARECLYNGKLFADREESARSYAAAKAEMEACENG